jgi:glycosyltransferase involved in cell wall biosynthesis
LVFEINGLANEEQQLKGHSFDNQILAFLIKKAEGTAVRSCNRVVSVTQQISDYLRRNFHCPLGKIRVIGNGVNIKRFYPIYDQTWVSSWRKKLGIAKDDLVVAFVGNLAPWQGMNFLLESAFQILANDEQNLKFLIVGEGIQKEFLIRKVSDSGYREKFIFTGMVAYEDVPILINIADICVAPFISRRNQTTGVSPIKIFEYMACGKPVICSRIDGLEFLEVEGAGRLVDPEDVIGLERMLKELINSPQERMRMGQRGLDLARERFSWESCAAKIGNLLAELA